MNKWYVRMFYHMHAGLHNPNGLVLSVCVLHHAIHKYLSKMCYVHEHRPHFPEHHEMLNLLSRRMRTDGNAIIQQKLDMRFSHRQLI